MVLALGKYARFFGGSDEHQGVETDWKQRILPHHHQA